MWRSWLTSSTPQPRRSRIRSISAYSSSWPEKSTPCAGLVEDQQVGPAQQRAGEQRALELAAGQLVHRRPAQMRRPTSASAPSRAVASRREADGQETLDRERQDRIELQALRHVADHQARRAPDHAGGRLQHAQERAQQGGLAGAVGADQRDDLAAPDREVDRAQELVPADPDGERPGLDQARRHSHQDAAGAAAWQRWQVPRTSTVSSRTAKP